MVAEGHHVYDGGGRWVGRRRCLCAARPAEERTRRMEFEIVREDLPPSMTVIESPAAAAQAAREAQDPFLP